MKLLYAVALATILVSSSTSYGQTTLYFNDFEGPDFDTYTLYDGSATPIAFVVPGGTYLDRNSPGAFPFGSPVTGFSGNIIGCENTDNAGISGLPYIRMDNINISGYVNLTISITFAAPRSGSGTIYETSDFVDLDYTVDASPWTQAHRLQGAADKNVYYDSGGDGVNMDANDILCGPAAQTFTWNVPATGNTMRIRITMATHGTNEEFAFDDILVEGMTPCNNPDVPTLSATPTTICPGSSATLDIVSGNLNDATDWEWYTGTCGGTSVGSGTSLSVSPASTTTYYARGEGGCVVGGSCDSVTVTVGDFTPPTALCQNITTYLDVTGNASITSADVDAGSSDNCVTPSLSLDDSTFTCADVGTNTVILTAFDGVSSSNCPAQVTVLDTIPPTVITQNINAYLDNQGQIISMPAGAIDGGSSDACAPLFYSASHSQFNCNDLGPVTVTLTVTDANGNSAQGTAIVTIIDTFPPFATSMPGDTTLVVNDTGCSANVFWTEATYDDNCQNYTLTSSHTPGANFPVGVTTVTYFATDPSGNVSVIDSFIITVNDDLNLSATSTDEMLGSDGMIDLTVTGSGGGYQYDWDNDGTGDFDDPEDPTGLAAGTYTVVVLDSNGCSDTLSITVDSQVGITDEFGAHITVYPNPSDGSFQISGFSHANARIELYNAAGQIVGTNVQKSDDTYSIQAQHNVPGMYLLRIATDQGIVTKRIVIR